MAERQEYMTVDEAAVLAKVSSVTIRRAIKAGTLRYRAQRGKTLLLAREDVEGWARSRTEIRLLEE
jgi:excisionase family DNA binding protein